MLKGGQCGKMPFARVASEWTHKNQTVPDHIQQRLARREASHIRSVRGISLDTDFSKIDVKQ